MATEATQRARDALRRSDALRPEHIKLPPFSDLVVSSTLPTPPTSSEMEKRHSFSSHADHDDELGFRDHLVVPSYGPIEDAYGPLFAPISSSHGRPKPSEPPRETSPMSRTAFLNKTLSAIVADFEQAIAQHSDNFRARHPTFRGPSIDDYRSVAAFSEQVRQRAPQELSQHSSPISRSKEPSQDEPAAHSNARVLAPRPYFTSTPVSEPSPLPEAPLKRSHRSNTEAAPSKRARLSSTVSFEEEDSVEPPRKRRSTTSSGRRRSSGPGSPKETKHNRNRSTKEKKSTNYLDYPGNIAPPFETMQDPKAAAELCPEHSVANPRNLQQDPLKDELHETERIVAQKLNIDCAYFLCVKRQIFQRYLEHLRTRSFNWNKTAAQQCSNVDVGKTSQIFMFFQRVGWFNEDLYQDKI